MKEEKGDAGRKGEELVIDHLVGNGYTILARNFSSRMGELDIVAERDGLLCFIEVRSRNDTLLGHPAETVNASKQRKIRKTAEYYLLRHGIQNRPLRFDVAAIIWNPKQGETPFEYYENAF